jgi:hypothetical protein
MENRPMIDVQAIASRIQLVTLNTSYWRASRVNRSETAKVNAEHGTGNKAHVRVRVCEHPALAEYAALSQQVYTDHLKLTRPSIQDGMRILPGAKYFEHTAMVRDAQDKGARLVAWFIGDYPTERANAPTILNGLYDENAWPSVESMADKFGIRARYLPCPSDGAWSEWLTESAQAATAELRDQIESGVRRIQERCASDGKLFSTVFTGLKELLDAVPDLDIANDSEIQRLADMARPLADLDAELVRDDDKLRTETANRASALLNLFQPGALSGI